MRMINYKENIKEDYLYICDNQELNEFLSENNIVYISSILYDEQNKIEWIYIKNQELLDLVEQFYIQENKKEGGEK